MSQRNEKVTNFTNETEINTKCKMPGHKGRWMKIDANQLINFKSESPPRHKNSKKASSFYQHHKTYYTKEHYLMANAQFVVKPDLDYTGYMTDIDQMLPWELILQIRVISNEMPSCPICLASLCAPRITKCGHIYCLPCLMHYYSLSTEKYAPCPVCSYSILFEDLKHVIVLEKRTFQVGDFVNLTKIACPVGFNCPLPCYLNSGNRREVLQYKDKCVQFAKIVTGDREFSHSLLLQDQQQLTIALKDELSDLNYIKEGLLLVQRELNYYVIKNTTLSGEFAALDMKEFGELQFETQFEIDKPDFNTSKPLVDEDNTDILFYQTADGQYVFIDPFNLAMLREEYGSLNRSPDRIRANILNIIHHIVDYNLRHRYRFLRHLPLQCEIQFLEVILRPPIVTYEVLSIFKTEIERRKQERNLKAKLELESDKKAAAYWSKTYPLFSAEFYTNPLYNKPDLSLDSFKPIETSNPDPELSETEQHEALSFARALSLVPKIASKPDTTPINPNSSTPVKKEDKNDSSTSDDEFTPPLISSTLYDGIADKLDAYLQQKDDVIQNNNSNNNSNNNKMTGRRCKRNKGKKIILFSTSSNRNS